MNLKYSNVFWHQGVKIFGEELFGTDTGKIRVEHLENDVTKALLNVFQHGDKKILGAFLRSIGMKQAPETFNFDFQVTDTNAYRQKKERIFLSIISSAPGKANSNYMAERSRPDACIFNQDTAILVEVKTQSRLILEQVESHIKHFFGTATRQERLSWEDVYETLESCKKSATHLGRFLLTQLAEFLNLLGLAEFKGFTASDFETLGDIVKISPEDYLDYKRLFHKKVEKFMRLLDKEIDPAFGFKTYKPHVGRVSPKSATLWSAFYFLDGTDTHVNYYPNLNFGFHERGLQLAFNAETQPAVKKITSFLQNSPGDFFRLSQRLKDFSFALYYKYQYLPKDHFLFKKELLRMKEMVEATIR